MDGRSTVWIARKLIFATRSTVAFSATLVTSLSVLMYDHGVPELDQQVDITDAC